MKTLTVSINESDFVKLGLKGTKISFKDLRERISTEMAGTALSRCHRIARDAECSGAGAGIARQPH